MKRTTLLAFALVALGSATLNAQDITGDWQGALPAGARSLRIIFRISKGDGGEWRAAFLSIDQAGFGNPRPASSVTLRDSTLKIAFDQARATYDGRIVADGSIRGTWTQNQGPQPLNFERATKETAWKDPWAVAADPKDVASVDAIIAAIYEANSVMVDQKRGADRFLSLFAPGARLIPTVMPPNGKGIIRAQTPEEYAAGAMNGPTRGGFREGEIARTSEAFGPIMQIFSTYESHRNASDQNPIRGINSIQLFNDGTRWWCVTIYWFPARPDTPIPAKYLPK